MPKQQSESADSDTRRGRPLRTRIPPYQPAPGSGRAPRWRRGPRERRPGSQAKQGQAAALAARGGARLRSACSGRLESGGGAPRLAEAVCRVNCTSESLARAPAVRPAPTAKRRPGDAAVPATGASGSASRAQPDIRVVQAVDGRSTRASPGRAGAPGGKHLQTSRDSRCRSTPARGAAAALAAGADYGAG